jgi:hypothetical protein
MVNFISLKVKEFWQRFVFYLRSYSCNRLFTKSLKNKDSLRVARRSDQNGNYDIDGVSFDGNHTFVNGKLN